MSASRFAELVYHVLLLLSVVGTVGATLLPLIPLLMVWSLKRMRLRASPERVELLGPDGMALLLAAPIGVGAVAGLVWLYPRWETLLGALLLVPSWVMGLRVWVCVGSQQAWVERRVFWIVPWSKRAMVRPVAWTDGWGDWADPEALYVGDGRNEDTAIELGWSGCKSGDLADRLAEQLNEEIARVRLGKMAGRTGAVR